jgi:hypothetical protein
MDQWEETVAEPLVSLLKSQAVPAVGVAGAGRNLDAVRDGALD